MIETVIVKLPEVPIKEWLFLLKKKKKKKKQFVPQFPLTLDDYIFMGL